VCTHTGRKAGRIRGPARGLSGLCIRGDYLWAPRTYVCERRCVCAWPNPLVAPGLLLSLARRSRSSLSLFLSLRAIVCVRVCACTYARARARASAESTADTHVRAPVVYTCTHTRACVTGFDRILHVCTRVGARASPYPCLRVHVYVHARARARLSVYAGGRVYVSPGLIRDYWSCVRRPPSKSKIQRTQLS